MDISEVCNKASWSETTSEQLGVYLRANVELYGLLAYYHVMPGYDLRVDDEMGTLS